MTAPSFQDFTSCQTRGGNVDEFFRHENQRSPPSLSQNGNLYQGSKLELLTKCLEPLSVVTDECPSVEVVIIDGAALVNMLKPGTSRTFNEYAATVFLPYICRQLETVQRIDVVWDIYIKDSLKGTTREKRGKGLRRRVEGRNTITFLPNPPSLIKPEIDLFEDASLSKLAYIGLLFIYGKFHA